MARPSNSELLRRWVWLDFMMFYSEVSRPEYVAKWGVDRNAFDRDLEAFAAMGFPTIETMLLEGNPTVFYRYNRRSVKAPMFSRNAR